MIDKHRSRIIFRYLLIAVACLLVSITTYSRANEAAESIEQAQVLYESGDLQEAVIAYDKAIELDRENATAYTIAYNNRGIVFTGQGKSQDALENFGQAIELDPAYAAAYFNRGQDYKSLTEYDSALDDYGRAGAADPDYANAYLGSQ